VWGDTHYRGGLSAETAARYGIRVAGVSELAGHTGFVPLPRRGVVERFVGWLLRGRRLVRDDERDPAYSEAWIPVAAMHQLLKHLAPDPSRPVPYQRRDAA
jgi:hypothetical protein